MPEREITIVQELIYELHVGEVMKEDPIIISPGAPMNELRDVLRENRISGVPVVDDGSLVGIVSLEDFIRWLVDGGPDCTVGERMTTELWTIHDDELLIQAVNRLEQFGFGRLPVLNRRTGRLTGMITKGDIIRGLLTKLEVSFREAEMRGARSRHIFEDIVADKSALVLEYTVAEDFASAGACASGLKTTLSRLGIPPETARRAAIAAYETEMNMVFYAGGGHMTATVEPRAIHLDAVDNGPGIEDVDAALRPGFSTAPDWVRELGFGAGMGLSNIQNCADRMELTSTLGKGTRLTVDILVEDRHDAE